MTTAPAELLRQYIDTIRSIVAWLDAVPTKAGDPPPIPMEYQKIITGVSIAATHIESRINALYTSLGSPYGPAPAGLLAFKNNLGMSASEADLYLLFREKDSAKESTCQSCGKPIIFTGTYWDHMEPKPRHPAIPTDDNNQKESTHE
jgi:hypothetical protein